MAPMSGAFDWLAVGDIAEERGAEHHPTIGGAAARLAALAANMRASVALAAKVGDDDAGRHLRDSLRRLGVSVSCLRTAAGVPTTRSFQMDGDAERRRIERGADLNLRLDELPPASLRAALTVVSGYALSVEPARSAAIGALAGAARRGGKGALLLEAELLWWTNARMTRRVLEPALAVADSVALSAADARVLFGSVAPRQAVRMVTEMGPKTVYFTDDRGAVFLRDGGRVHSWTATGSEPPRDRLARPAAFWVGLARRMPAPKAAEASLRYAGGGRRAARL